MLRLSEAAAKLVIDVMSQQGLDPLRDVFEVIENDEGFAVSFTRDLAPTDVVNGLRVFYRGNSLDIDISKEKVGLIFTANKSKQVM